MSRAVVADRYRAERINGKYDRSRKSIDRAKMVVTPEFVEEMNSRVDSPLFFIVNDEETEKFYQKQEENNQKRAEKIAKKKARQNVDFEALFAGKVVESGSPEITEEDEDNEKSEFEKKLKDKKVDELKTACENLEIEIDEGDKKADLIRKIMEKQFSPKEEGRKTERPTE